MININNNDDDDDDDNISKGRCHSSIMMTKHKWNLATKIPPDRFAQSYVPPLHSIYIQEPNGCTHTPVRRAHSATPTSTSKKSIEACAKKKKHPQNTT